MIRISPGCSVEIHRTRQLERDLRDLEERFPGFADDFKIAERILKVDPFRGSPISSSSSAQSSKNRSLRKMQVHSKAAKRGANKGFRLVYNIQRDKDTFHVNLLQVYFKGDKEDLTSAEYARLEKILVEIERD